MGRRKASHVAFNDRRVSIAAGLACVVVGSLLLHDAYEKRGESRPWALRFLPSP